LTGNNRLTAYMATKPGREACAQTAIASLRDQLDEIRVVFNGYPAIPEWAAEDGKISPQLCSSNGEASCAVWRLLARGGGYAFIVDDDILYPPDYIEVMKAKLDARERKAIVTVHGTRFPRHYSDYKHDRKLTHFKRAAAQDTPVHMGGVGCCAFHTDFFSPRPEEFPDSWMRDVWFAVKAAKEKREIICIARPDGWVQSLANDDETVWDTVLNDPALRARKNSVIEKHLLPLFF